jgi:hypothetical protein
MALPFLRELYGRDNSDRTTVQLHMGRSPIGRSGIVQPNGAPVTVGLDFGQARSQPLPPVGVLHVKADSSANVAAWSFVIST